MALQRRGRWGGLLIVLLVASGSWAQDVNSGGSVPAQGDIYESGNPQGSPGQGDIYESGSSGSYGDEFSNDCEQGNTSPFAGMNPLTCHGVMAPTDTAGNCSLPRMTLLQQVGRECYYCQPLNPPINGIIIPYDQLREAGRQGFKCGVDQADVNCKAICTRESRANYVPPPGTTYIPPSIPPSVPSSGGSPAPTPPQPAKSCVNAPFDVRADVPSAAPQMRYTLGFERGFAGCLESQVTLQNIALAAAASRFKAIAALLVVAASPGVIDAVLHPPQASINPNPYQEGNEEGSRLCTWALKISPAAVARCPVASETAATCSASTIAKSWAQVFGADAAQATRRFDCFVCTLAWLRRDAYTPPEGGGSPWTLTQIEAFLERQYGSLTPQGPALPCWRQAAQAKGMPGTMSPTGIENEMKAAGNGAQGFVFMYDPNGGGFGHVIGAKTVGSGNSAQVIFWDQQQLMPGQWWFQPGQWLTFYRTQ